MRYGFDSKSISKHWKNVRSGLDNRLCLLMPLRHAFISPYLHSKNDLMVGNGPKDGKEYVTLVIRIH